MLQAGRSLRKTERDIWRGFAHLCADIFPIHTEEIPVLQRLSTREQSCGTGAVLSHSPVLLPKPVQALNVPAETVKSWNLKELRSFIQQRGWSIATSGAGRTRHAIQEDILFKMSSESSSTAVTQEPSVQVTDNGSLFATSTDLSQWQCRDWGNPDAPVSPWVRCSLATEVLQWHSRRPSVPRQARRARWTTYDIQLVPKFKFRARMLGDQPCVDVLVHHVAKPPPGLNLAEMFGDRPEIALGVRVQSLPNGLRGEVVEYVGQLGDGTLRDELLGLTKTDEMRAAIVSASGHMPVWGLRPDRHHSISHSERIHGTEHRPVTFRYIGSKLQPLLTVDNLEYLEKVVGKFTGQSLGLASVINPCERKRFIEQELQSIAAKVPLIGAKLFSSTLHHRISTHVTCANGRYGDRFGCFQPPRRLVGGGRAVEATSGSVLWAALKRQGLYRYEPGIGQNVTVRGYVLDPSASQHHNQRARRYMSGIVRLLQDVHVEVDVNSRLISSARSVAAVLSDAERHGAHVVILFATAYSANWYHAAKSQCLQRKAPGLFHMACQWVNLNRDEHKLPALMNIALQMLAKLGHTPYVLDTSTRPQPATGLEPIVCGLDVSHVFNPHLGQMEHATAGLQLQRMSGEVMHSWLYQGKISGESIPPWIWQQVVSKEACQGREVIIHRDGRFTDQEKKFLADHAQEVGVARPFGLVEIVKYAAGTPRMYAEDGNAPSGSFLRLSDNECLLTSGSLRSSGTRNPLLIRTVDNKYCSARSVLPIEKAAEDVFRLSMVSYGNLYSSPRLPVTTKTADKAAYFHASVRVQQSMAKSAEMNGGRKVARCDGSSLVSHGRQQYWL